jgi:membrane-bound acyltransferase YfiQ involved in biofilm formation
MPNIKSVYLYWLFIQRKYWSIFSQLLKENMISSVILNIIHIIFPFINRPYNSYLQFIGNWPFFLKLIK